MSQQATQQDSQAAQQEAQAAQQGTQVKIEDEMMQRGVERYDSRLRKSQEKERLSTFGAGAVLLRRTLLPLITAIEGWIEAVESGEAKKLPTAAKYLSQVKPEVAAYMAASTVINALGSSNRGHQLLSWVAAKIGKQIEDELRFAAFSKQDARVYTAVQRRLRRIAGQDYRHRRAVLAHAERKAEQEGGVKAWTHWTPKTHAHVGLVLIDLMLTSCGNIVTLEKAAVPGKRHARHVLRPTEDTVRWLEQVNESTSVLTPVYLPCVQEPLPWSAADDGGYHTLRLPLVKGLRGKHGKRYLDALSYDQMPTVYDALNTLQLTAWCVNRKVLGVAQELWERGIDGGGIPSKHGHELPPKPHDIEENEEARKLWRKAAATVHDHNARQLGKRIATSMTLSLARRMEHFERMYFPYQLDFRGRAYAVPQFLNPQGNDLSKALLTFSDAKPLGSTGAWWLAIHGANSFGVDKVSFDERVAWVTEHDAEIKLSAQDPISYRWWQEADSPFQFLAFCFEWAGYQEHGEEYMCALPVSVDGSCNGLQHYAALTRDSHGASAVNLLRSDKPQDVYQRVADALTEELTKSAPFDAQARAWLESGLITRKLVKRPVMTLPYGVTLFGVRDHLRQELTSMADEKGPLFPEDAKGWRAAEWLAPQLWAAMRRGVGSAIDAMSWLQKVAAACIEAGVTTVEWSSPLGFPVVQRYLRRKEITVDTKVQGKRLRVTLRQDTDKANAQKQRSAVAPNFVHALDASHLYSTIKLASECGLTAFAAVHDSYGTHACDVEALGTALRKTFVDQYQADWLMRFSVDAMEQAGVPEEKREELVAERPPFGGLDVSKVLDSPFFFA